MELSTLIIILSAIFITWVIRAQEPATQKKMLLAAALNVLFVGALIILSYFDWAKGILDFIGSFSVVVCALIVVYISFRIFRG